MLHLFESADAKRGYACDCGNNPHVKFFFKQFALRLAFAQVFRRIPASITCSPPRRAETKRAISTRACRCEMIERSAIRKIAASRRAIRWSVLF